MRQTVEPKNNANPTYHALSVAISALNRARGGEVNGVRKVATVWGDVVRRVCTYLRPLLRHR